MQACSHAFAAKAHEANRICPHEHLFQQVCAAICWTHRWHAFNVYKAWIQDASKNPCSIGSESRLGAILGGDENWSLSGLASSGGHFSHRQRREATLWSRLFCADPYLWIVDEHRQALLGAVMLLCHRREPRSWAAQSFPSGCKARIRAACTAPHHYCLPRSNWRWFFYGGEISWNEGQDFGRCTHLALQQPR